MIRKIIIFSVVCVYAFFAAAQDMTHLYAIGDAIPGGIQELTPFPGNQFKYAGPLNEGTFRISNTPEHKLTASRYLKPNNEDAYIVNNGLSYTLVRDSKDVDWVVPFSEDVFRFTVNLNNSTVTGELFRPWNELFIVGGATECGWATYTFLPFTRLENEVCTWEWTGVLKYRPENNEPRHFKFSGQNAWEPKMLHPFTNDEDVLKSTKFITNGTADNKWSVVDDGVYHIVVDVFRETMYAEYLSNKTVTGDATEVDGQMAQNVSIRHRDNEVQVTCEASICVDVYNTAGHRIYHGVSTHHSIPLPQQGLYVVKAGECIRKVLY